MNETEMINQTKWKTIIEIIVFFEVAGLTICVISLENQLPDTSKNTFCCPPCHNPGKYDKYVEVNEKTIQSVKQC